MIVERCENWGLWQRVMAASHTAESLEGCYRSPRGAEVDWQIVAPPVWSPAIDAKDAQIVESAMGAIPVYSHALLRAWYVWKVKPEDALWLAAREAKERRGRLRGFDATLDMAHSLLTGALDLPPWVRKQRARERVLAVLTGGNEDD